MNRNHSLLIFLYLVFSSCAAVSAQEFNVTTAHSNILYRDVSNLLQFTVRCCSCDSIILVADNGNIERIATPCKFFIRPFSNLASESLVLTLKVKDKGDTLIIGKKKFEIKDYPAVKAGLDNNQSGSISKRVLLGHSQILVYPPFEMHMGIKIKQFSILIFRNDDIIYYKRFHQEYFDKEIYETFSKLKKGDTVIFFNILTNRSFDLPELNLSPIEFIIED